MRPCRKLVSLAIVLAAACGEVKDPIGPGVDGSVAIDAPEAPPIDAPRPMRTVTVAVAGNGTRPVTSTPAGLSCPGTCTLTVPDGSQVTLAAAPQGASMFLGWTGACTGTGACTLTVSADTTVTASFALDHTLIVTRAGTGSGTVRSSPAGIDCGADCDQTFAAGTTVTLTAMPAGDSTFTGWSGGGCSGTGTCTVTVNAATAVTASFTLQRWTLTTATGGTGGGTIRSTPAGIDCGATCTATYDHGTMVTLAAMPDGQSIFTGWTGACSGSGVCTVTMDQARTVGATFTLATHGLTVTRAGNGAALGTVVSSPAGISCGGDCSEAFTAGSVVTLTASAVTGASFTGWSGGGCSGTSTCTVTVNAAVSVTATFTLARYTLTVNRAGTGTGTVMGAGIDCGGDCSENVDHGSTVTLTATAGPNSTFTGWSGGGCSGTGTCAVTVTAATSVTATFDPTPRTLTVNRAGNGVGTVTGTGINCGGDCSESVPHGTMITLTAAAATAPAASLSTFTGWSGGGCSGTGTCTVTLTAATSVTASFDLRPNVAFVTSTSYTGAMGGLAGADAACQARAQAGGLSGTYRAWLSSTTSNALARFGSASGWVRPDGKAFANSQADLAAGKLFHPLVLDESGMAARGKTVRTATNPQGMWNGTSTCADWTDAGAAAGSSTSGNNDYGTFSWTSNGSASCASSYALYCFGVDRAAVVAPPAQSNVRRAFLSNGSFVASGGQAGADTLCQNEASAAGLQGTFRALLATSGSSAASRFDTFGQAWARVDNVLLASSASVFLGAATTGWDAALNVTASGAYTTGRAWTGADGLTTAGTMASTCNAWSTTSGAVAGWVGIPQSSWVATAFANYATTSSLTGCDNQYKVYCLQL